MSVKELASGMRKIWRLDCVRLSGIRGMQGRAEMGYNTGGLLVTDQEGAC
jgi:hypothetical protein